MVDKLAQDLAGSWRRSFRFRAHLGRVSLGGEDILLVKPQTFMNSSGAAVAAVLRYHGSAATDMIVVLDDADLDLGRIRIRPRGSSGGHKGLESIVQNVQSQDFARLRIGIGRGESRADLVEHVLQPFVEAEWRQMAPVIETAAAAVRLIVERNVEEAMNQYNGLPPLFGKPEPS